MPRGDKTGPNGNGPRTGRGLGYCAGNNRPGYLTDNNFRQGRGFGRGYGFRNGGGRGFGFGYRHEFSDNYTENYIDVSEKTIIENQINVLKDKLTALEEKLKKLTKN